jgi:hypothetical protein
MFRLTNKAILDLQTPAEVLAKVQELKALGGTIGEREDKELREARILAKILSDEMIPFIWVAGYVPSEGIGRRCDGMHSGEVFQKLTTEQWAQVRFPVVVFYQEYDCDTRQDLGILFEQFNARWSARSNEDLIGAHLANYDDLHDMNRYAANTATKGLEWYMKQVEKHHITGENEHFQLVYANHDIHAFLHFCGKELGLSKNIIDLTSRPVIAAMFHTTRQGNESDRFFWRRVAGGTHANYDETTHEYKLAAFLAQCRDCNYEWPSAARRAFGARVRPNDVEIFATCLRVFAAYKKGMPLTEAFAPVRQKDPAILASTIYPLHVPQAA